MGLFGRYRAMKAQQEAEKRQLGYEKETIQRAAEVNPQSEQNVHAIIEGRADLQRWQQQLKEDFDMLLGELGYKELADGSLVPRNGEAKLLCNKECCKYIKSVLTPFYFRSVSITKLDKPQIMEIMMTTMQKMTIKLDCFMYEFAIQTTADTSNILLLVENIIMPILYRSLDGFTKKEDSGARKILEDATIQMNQRESIFKRMAGLVPT
jgi:hypothetical protein